MAVDSLRAHLVEELTDLLDAENQLTRTLPTMAKAATTPSLKKAFQRHLEETRGQVTRLDKALRELGETPRRKTCEAMKGLLREGAHLMRQAPEGTLRDAVMITAAQKVEHYEMASYGTARTYAHVLGEPRVARLLEQTLKEEKAADGTLTTIAESSVNEAAAEEWLAQEDGLVERSAFWVGRAIGAASRRLAGGARRTAASVGLAQERPKRSTSTGPRSARKRTQAKRKATSKPR
jgi:ferritin-like metal-binding protein YciE